MTNRPTNFNDVIGQSEVVNRLKVTTDGCKNAGVVHPHVLIDGPPGLGKTTLAGAIAHELGVDLHITNAANLRKVKNILPYLLRMTRRSVLFIDEIHRLPTLVEEFLYPVMEDFKINIILEKEPEEIDIPAFTLIGATTSGGSLSQPFYDRFQIKEHLRFYNTEELVQLAKANTERLGLNLDNEALSEIAKRSKGTPRILNARIQWFQMYTASGDNNKLSVDEVFSTQGIDENGLDVYDRIYIQVLQQNIGNPLGLKAISSMTGIAIDTIENSIEPYLLRTGMVQRTQKGRILGKHAKNINCDISGGHN
jgi:Holliday junction DNA helicase RuvB